MPLYMLTAAIPNGIVARWKENLAASTASTRRKELRRLLHWLVKLGAAPELTTLLTQARQPRPRTTIATPEELTALHRNACPWMRCYLALTATHGMRLAEALRLAPAHLDTTTNTVTFRTKGNQTNTIPVSDELRAFFDAAPVAVDPNTPLLELLAGRELNQSYVWDAWTALKKRAGVNPLLRTHDLRRTLAVQLYDLTRDLRVVQQALGHTNLMTTCLYLEHRDPAAIRPLVNELTYQKLGRRPAHAN